MISAIFSVPRWIIPPGTRFDLPISCFLLSFLLWSVRGFGLHFRRLLGCARRDITPPPLSLLLILRLLLASVFSQGVALPLSLRKASVNWSSKVAASKRVLYR